MSDMSIKEAIEWLTQAVPIRALTEEDFAKFIKAVNMAIDSLEADEAYQLEYEPTTKNDLGVDWESYKDADGNSLDDLILEVLKNNFDCGNTYGYKVADEIIELLPSVTPQEPRKGYLSIDDVMSVFDDFMCGDVDEEGTETFLEMLKDKAEIEPQESEDNK